MVWKFVAVGTIVALLSTAMASQAAGKSEPAADQAASTLATSVGGTAASDDLADVGVAHRVGQVNLGGGGFVLIIVLFILLVIVGAGFGWGYGSGALPSG